MHEQVCFLHQAFVEELLEHAVAGLEGEDPTDRDEVTTNLRQIQNQNDTTPGVKVLDMRYVAGCTKDGYLRDGIARIAVLGKECDDAALHTLYATRSTEAVRRSVLTSIEHARADKVAEAEVGIPLVATFLWVYRQMKAVAAAQAPSVALVRVGADDVDESELRSDDDDTLLHRLSTGNGRPSNADLHRFREILVDMRTHIRQPGGGGVADTFLGIVEEQRDAFHEERQRMQRAYNALEEDCQAAEESILNFVLEQVQAAASVASAEEGSEAGDEVATGTNDLLATANRGFRYFFSERFLSRLMKVALTSVGTIQLTRTAWQMIGRALLLFTNATTATQFVESVMDKNETASTIVFEHMRWLWVYRTASVKKAARRGVRFSPLHLKNETDWYYGTVKNVNRGFILEPQNMTYKIFGRVDVTETTNALITTLNDVGLLTVLNETHPDRKEGIVYHVQMTTEEGPRGTVRYVLKANDALRTLIQRGKGTNLQEKRVLEVSTALDYLTAFEASEIAAWKYNAETGYFRRAMPPVLEEALRTERPFVEEALRRGYSTVRFGEDPFDYLQVAMVAELKARTAQTPNVTLAGIIGQRGSLTKYSGTNNSIVERYNVSSDEVKNAGIDPEYAPEFPTMPVGAGPQDAPPERRFLMEWKDAFGNAYSTSNRAVVYPWEAHQLRAGTNAAYIARNFKDLTPPEQELALRAVNAFPLCFAEERVLVEFGDTLRYGANQYYNEYPNPNSNQGEDKPVEGFFERIRETVRGLGPGDYGEFGFPPRLNVTPPPPQPGLGGLGGTPLGVELCYALPDTALLRKMHVQHAALVTTAATLAPQAREVVTATPKERVALAGARETMRQSLATVPLSTVALQSETVTLAHLGRRCTELAAAEAPEEARVFRSAAAALKLRQVECQLASRKRPTTATGTIFNTEMPMRDPSTFTSGDLDRMTQAGIAHVDTFGTSDEAFAEYIAQERDVIANRSPGATYVARREALWEQVLLEVSTSSDRLLVFLRNLAGCIGESVEALLISDPRAEEAQKAREEQELAVSKRISDCHARIIETILGGLSSKSNLSLTRNQGGVFVVVDALARERLAELSRGDPTGKQFFASSVTLSNLAQANAAATEVGLRELLASVNSIAAQLRDSLMGEVVDQYGVAASIDALRLPRHSAILTLRHDCLAAIGQAYDRVLNHCTDLRRPISLYELVESGNPALSLRFAEVVAHLLQASRQQMGTASVGKSVQIQRGAVVCNAMQARVNFDRLKHAVQAHIHTCPQTPTLPQSGSSVTSQRLALLSRAASVPRIVAPRHARAGNAYGA